MSKIARLRRSDRDCVDLILAATKEAPGGDRLDISQVDKAALWKDIWLPVAICQAASDVNSSQNKRQLRRRKIAKKAHELKDLLEADRADDDCVFARCYTRNKPNPHNVLVDLEAAAKQAMELVIDQPAFEGPTRRRLETMVPRLRVAYEKHLGDKRRYTKIDDEVDGPFIRFADTALWELGITKSNGERYAYATISSALTNSRK